MVVVCYGGLAEEKTNNNSVFVAHGQLDCNCPRSTSVSDYYVKLLVYAMRQKIAKNSVHTTKRGYIANQNDRNLCNELDSTSSDAITMWL